MNASPIGVTVKVGGGGLIKAWQEEKLLHVGAEASVFSGWYLGLAAVRKERRPRGYRHPSLDRRLTKSRMAAEARMLSRLAAKKLPIPRLLAVDATSGVMVQSLMAGRPIIECLRDSECDARAILTEAGEVIRRLHSCGAVHGDLTTNNILWDSEIGISIIDFGLAKWTTEVERLGLDLQVLNECLTASHPEHEEAVNWLITGYLSNPENDEKWDGSDTPPPACDLVISRFDQIRSRVRYHG